MWILKPEMFIDLIFKYVCRYIAVRIQANPTLGLTNMQTKHTILTIWIIALVSTFPWALKFNIVFSEAQQLNFCEETWNKQLDDIMYFIFANVIARFLVPLLSIFFLGIGIWRTIHTYTVPTHWSPAYQELRKRKRVNILKLLASLCLAFFICWLPYYVVMCIEKGTKSMDQQNHSSEMTTTPSLVHLLGFLNSCVNPLIYGFLDENFKISFQSLFVSTPTHFQREERVHYRRRRDDEGGFQEVVEIPGPQGW